MEVQHLGMVVAILGELMNHFFVFLKKLRWNMLYLKVDEMENFFPHSGVFYKIYQKRIELFILF